MCISEYSFTSQNHLTCLSVLDVMLWHQRLGYASFLKLVSEQILCVEKSVHMLFDKTNSLNKNDAQDKEFELDLARKDLLLMHEKGKCSEEGIGPAAGSSKGGQGLNQSGEITAEPCLVQNQSNFPRTGSETVSRTASEQVPNRLRKQVPE